MREHTKHQKPAQDKCAQAIHLLRCALADLEGEIDNIDPDGAFGGDGHPARQTMTEIRIFLQSIDSLPQ